LCIQYLTRTTRLKQCDARGFFRLVRGEKILQACFILDARPMIPITPSEPVYLLVVTPPVQGRRSQSRLLGGKGDPMPYNCFKLVPRLKIFSLKKLPNNIDKQFLNKKNQGGGGEAYRYNCLLNVLRVPQTDLFEVKIKKFLKRKNCTAVF